MISAVELARQRSLDTMQLMSSIPSAAARAPSAPASDRGGSA